MTAPDPYDELDPTAAQHVGDTGDDERHDPLSNDRFAEPEGYVGESFPAYPPTQQPSDLVVPAEQSPDLDRLDAPPEVPHFTPELQRKLARSAIWLGALAVVGMVVAMVTGIYWLFLLCVIPLLAVCMVAVKDLTQRPPS
ncbi:hypothetical protein ACQBAR_17145 [Propionibacteriaceae bacterium Y1685]